MLPSTHRNRILQALVLMRWPRFLYDLLQGRNSCINFCLQGNFISKQFLSVIVKRVCHREECVYYQFG